MLEYAILNYLEEEGRLCLPKLIIADLHLFGMKGTQFLKDLKQMDKNRHIPAIVLSTIKFLKEIENCKQMGALEYLEIACTHPEYLAAIASMKRKMEA